MPTIKIRPEVFAKLRQRGYTVDEMVAGVRAALEKTGKRKLRVVRDWRAIPPDFGA